MKCFFFFLNFVWEKDDEMELPLEGFHYLASTTATLLMGKSSYATESNTLELKNSTVGCLSRRSSRSVHVGLSI